MFVSWKHFQPNLSLATFQKMLQCDEIAAYGQRLQLIRRSVSEDEKIFYNADTCFQRDKHFFFSVIDAPEK